MQQSSKLVIFIVIVLLSLFLIVWQFRDPLLERALEMGLNQTQQLFFAGTLDMEGVHLDRSLKIQIREIRGDWQTLSGPFPIEAHEIKLQDNLVHLIFRKPVRITFEKFRPRGSSNDGIHGQAILHQDREGTFELAADFVDLALEEIVALNPENLEGASGHMAGSLYIKTTARGDQDFRLNLKVPKPGGQLQARFFDILLPYIPPVQKKTIQNLSTLKIIHYKEADFSANLAGRDSIKMFFHIQIPDYNLNLNLNVLVRVEDQDTFFRLAQLWGLILVKKA